MRDARGATGSGPAVCPFVALVEDRDRRADGPDSRNRCYATPAPRQRELAYQAEYCYSERFSTCAAFLDWAARNAAEPSYPVPGIQAARAAVEPDAASNPTGTHAARAPADPSIEPELGSAPPALASGVGDQSDWVSASAWTEFPGAALEDEPIAEIEEVPEEVAAIDGDGGLDERDEPTTAPRVPAALPMRRRRRPLQPIRARGSGEWYYSDPPDREPLVRRRYASVPPVVLGAVGLLVASLVVLLIPSLLAGGGERRIAGASGSPHASARVAATPRPTARSTAATSPGEATPETPRRRRTYRVRSGDSLSRIASRFGVSMELLQCQNLIRNPNLIAVGQELTIPPDGYVCAPGWRRATPTPVPRGSPAATEATG